MNKKFLSIMTALLLMITMFVPFNKAIAAIFVEYLILPVAANNTEIVELYYVPRPSQANPLPNEAQLVTGYDFIIDVASTVNSTCNQTIQAPVEATHGLNVMTLATSNNHLVVNGKEIGDELIDCLGIAPRLVYQLGVLLSPNSENGQPSDVPPEEPRTGLPTIVGYSISDSNGATVAASSWVGTGWDLSVGEVTID